MDPPPHQKKKTKALVFPLFMYFLFFSLISCQMTPPDTQDGFWYGKKQTAPYESSVLIEAFFDPVCPDSRDSWPPLKQALNHYYGHRVSLVVHTAPLPYHDNAFVSSRALHIANKLNSSTTYELLESFFNHQERFYGETTFNMSGVAIIEQIVEFATDTVGSSYRSAIRSGFSDSKTDRATRVAFKYGCLRGVYGTPYFFVNGFPLSDESSPMDYKKWIEVLDPLISKQKPIFEASKAIYYNIYG